MKCYQHINCPMMHAVHYRAIDMEHLCFMRYFSNLSKQVSHKNFMLEKKLIVSVNVQPSLLGITVYKGVMSMVKIILFSPEKLKLWNISSAWLLSLLYEGSDFTMGFITLSKWLKISSVGQLHAETIGRHGLLGL